MTDEASQVPGATPAVVDQTAEPPKPLPSVADTIRDLERGGDLDLGADEAPEAPSDDDGEAEGQPTDTPMRTELRKQLEDYDFDQLMGESDDRIASDPDFSEDDDEEEDEGEGDEESPDDEQPDSEDDDSDDRWSAEQLAVLDNLSEEDREVMEDWAREIQRGAQRKFDAAARMRREFEAIGEVLKPISAEIKQARMSPADAMREVVGLYRALSTRPLETIDFVADKLSASGTLKGSAQARQTVARMARALGVDGEDYGGDPWSEADDATSAEIRSLKQQIDALHGDIAQGRAQTREQQVVSEIRRELDDFSARHPEHARDDALQATMARLIETGMADGLNDAYRMALRIEGLEDAPRARRANGAKARRASTPRGGSGNGNAREPDPIDRITDPDPKRQADLRLRAELVRQVNRAMGGSAGRL